MHSVRFPLPLSVGVCFVAIAYFCALPIIPAVLICLAVAVGLTLIDHNQGSTTPTSNHTMPSPATVPEAATTTSPANCHTVGNTSDSNCLNRDVSHNSLWSSDVAARRTDRQYSSGFGDRVTLQNNLQSYSSPPAFQLQTAEPYLRTRNAFTATGRDVETSSRQSNNVQPNLDLRFTRDLPVGAGGTEMTGPLPQFGQVTNRDGLGLQNCSTASYANTALSQSSVTYSPLYVGVGILPTFRPFQFQQSQSFLGRHNSHMLGQPTVKVAPPDNLTSPLHLFPSPSSVSEGENMWQPVTSGLFSAFHGKRKRSVLEDTEPSSLNHAAVNTDTNEQQTKRLRSQHLNDNNSVDADVMDVDSRSAITNSVPPLSADRLNNPAASSTSHLPDNLRTPSHSSLNSSKRPPPFTIVTQDSSESEERCCKRQRQCSESSQQNSVASATVTAASRPVYCGTRNPIEVSYTSVQRWQMRSHGNNVETSPPSSSHVRQGSDSVLGRHHPYSTASRASSRHNSTSHSQDQAVDVNSSPATAAAVLVTSRSCLPSSAHASGRNTPASNVNDRLSLIAEDNASVSSLNRRLHSRLTPSQADLVPSTYRISPSRQQLTAEDFERDRQRELDRVRQMITGDTDKSLEGKQQEKQQSVDIVTVDLPVLSTCSLSTQSPVVSVTAAATTSVSILPTTAVTASLTAPTVTSLLPSAPSATSALPSAGFAVPTTGAAFTFPAVPTTAATTATAVATTAVATTSATSTAASSQASIAFKPIFPSDATTTTTPTVVGGFQFTGSLATPNVSNVVTTSAPSALTSSATPITPTKTFAALLSSLVSNTAHTAGSTLPFVPAAAGDGTSLTSTTSSSSTTTTTTTTCSMSTFSLSQTSWNNAATTGALSSETNSLNWTANPSIFGAGLDGITIPPSTVPTPAATPTVPQLSFNAPASNTFATPSTNSVNVFSVTPTTTTTTSGFRPVGNGVFGTMPFGIANTTAATPPPSYGSISTQASSIRFGNSSFQFGNSAMPAAGPMFGNSATPAAGPMFGYSATSSTNPLLGQPTLNLGGNAAANHVGTQPTGPVFGLSNSSVTTTVPSVFAFGAPAAAAAGGGTLPAFGTFGSIGASSNPSIGFNFQIPGTFNFGASQSPVAPTPTFGGFSANAAANPAVNSQPGFNPFQPTAVPTPFGSSPYAPAPAMFSIGSGGNTSKSRMAASKHKRGTRR